MSGTSTLREIKVAVLWFLFLIMVLQLSVDIIQALFGSMQLNENLQLHYQKIGDLTNDFIRQDY